MSKPESLLIWFRYKDNSFFIEYGEFNQSFYTENVS